MKTPNGTKYGETSRGLSPPIRQDMRWKRFEAFWDIPIVAVIGVVGFVLCSIKLKQDINWDLQNYHFYAAYAVLHGRLWEDLLPSGIQSYLNPLPYVHYYLLVNHLPPKWAAAGVGGLQGLSVALIYSLTSRIVLNENATLPWERFFFASLSTLVGVASPMLLSEVGTSFADIYSAEFIILSLIILFGRFVPTNDRVNLAQILAAGIIVGVATGFKLTNAVFGVAGAFSIAIIIAPRVINLSVWISGAVVGFALTGGFWALRVFERFGNPFFPYWNGIFRSALYDPSNLSDRLYLPHSLQHALAYPFLWLAGHNATAQVSFTDARFAVLSVLSIPAAVMLTRSVVIATKNKKQPKDVFDQAFVKRIPALFISIFF